jgi:predicted DNA-binding transcriptional regulator AlpA
MVNEVNSPTLKDPEAAHYIGMSESWLRQSRMRGNPDAPPYLKISKAVRYLRTDLDDWLEKRRHVEPEVT